MKRRRRPEPFVMKVIRANAYTGKVIPPRSVVKLLSPWGNDQGRVFRIGYYSRMDGLNCVWLVNEAGEYEQTTDQKSIDEDFEILELSDETDLRGDDREVLGPISLVELPKAKDAAHPNNRLYSELWTSLASLLRSYTAVHGLHSKREAAVELTEKEITVFHKEKWLRLERNHAILTWARENGNMGTLELTESGTLRSETQEEAMDLAAEQWARDLMR